MARTRSPKKRSGRQSLENRVARENPLLSFEFEPGQLRLGGPVIVPLLGVNSAHAQALRDAGQPVPDPIRCRFLIDTGAAGCLVKHEIAERAGLKLINDNVPMHGVGVDASGRIYMGRIVFQCPSNADPTVQHNIAVETRISTGALENAKTLDGLVGRDVLSGVELLYNGRTGRVTMKLIRQE